MSEHPVLPGRIAPSNHADSEHSWPVASTTERYSSHYLTVRTDAIVDPSGQTHDRVIVQPRGAVGIVAMDDEDRILLVEQYRHSVGARLLEIPAGTLDVAGEDARTTAERELAEEGDIAADQWEELFTMAATPGYSTERWTLFRASGLHAIPPEARIDRHAEEADLDQWWMPLEDAVEGVLHGRISDALTVAGILAERVRRLS